MFRVSGFESQVSGFGFKVTSGMGFRGWGVGKHLLVAVWHVEQNLCFGFRVSGFGFRVLGFGFRISGFGFTEKTTYEHCWADIEYVSRFAQGIFHVAPDIRGRPYPVAF